MLKNGRNKMMIIKRLKRLVLIFCTALMFCTFNANSAKAWNWETRSSTNCTGEEMTCIYIDETACKDYKKNSNKSDAPNAKESCWYCKIVIVLVNAYLTAAKAAMGTTISLGRVILKVGFLVWLAYYILQQVSSIEPVTPGKMLQEILVMGFKVALAYLFLEEGTKLVIDYYVNPIVEVGVDYGSEIFNHMWKPNAQ